MSESEVTSVEEKPEVESIEPVASAASAEAITPVTETVAADTTSDNPSSSSKPDSDQEVFDGSPYSSKNVQNYINQQLAEESGNSLGNGGGDGRPVGEIGRQKQQEKTEKAKDDFLEFHEQSQQAAERRKEWLERDHDFGGQKMSGHDLDKLIHLYANNPQMQDKLKDRLQKNGMSKDRADKGVKEFQEYMDLKKKEQSGELSPAEQARLNEINKSNEFKIVAQAAVNEAKNDGIKLGYTSSQNAVEKVERKDAFSKIFETRDPSIQLSADDNFGKNHFNNAPDLKPAFTNSASTSTNITTANKKLEGAVSDDDFALDASSVTQIQTARATPKTAVAGMNA